jgi:dihydrolipoamide dehydrogenase
MSKIAIIGGGFAGYTAAVALCAKNDVILIEKERLGGNCLNKGCIPTKLFIEAKEKNWVKMQERMNKIVQDIASGMKFLADSRRITYINDEARILSQKSLSLKNSGKVVGVDILILALGSEPVIPGVFADVPSVITSDGVWALQEAPKRIAVIGAGFMGVEFAGIFRSLGSEVTLIEMGSAILPSIDKDASAIVAASMANKGIKIATGRYVKKIQNSLICLDDGQELPFDKILVCTGRKAKQIQSEIPLDLENGCIKTDGLFSTSQDNIYAIGDCTAGPLLAHRAVYDAELLAQNLLTEGKTKKDYSKIPFCVFSSPPICGIGTMESLKTVKVGFTAIGRAYCDDSTEGFVKLAVDNNKNAMGAVVVNKNALEILAALTVIVDQSMNCAEIARIPFTHPTSSEILKEAARRLL